MLRGASWRLLNADTSRSTRGGCVSTSRVLEVMLPAPVHAVHNHSLGKATELPVPSRLRPLKKPPTEKPSSPAATCPASHCCPPCSWQQTTSATSTTALP